MYVYDEQRVNYDCGFRMLFSTSDSSPTFNQRCGTVADFYERYQIKQAPD